MINHWTISPATAVRDAACTSWHDDAWTQWCRQVVLYSYYDEGDDGLWGSSPRDEDEPQGHHSPTDVWSSGCSHQWLDRWYLLDPVEENTEIKEGYDNEHLIWAFKQELAEVIDNLTDKQLSL